MIQAKGKAIDVWIVGLELELGDLPDVWKFGRLCELRCKVLECLLAIANFLETRLVMKCFRNPRSGLQNDSTFEHHCAMLNISST